MCTIFNDAKRGTLSAWSWPSREVVNLKRQRLDLSKNVPLLETFEGDLQYVSPSNYREIMNCIVEADIINLKNKLKKCLAISLRCDGSVDRSQIDNIHVLAKVVTEKGDIELMFIGFEEPKTKGSLGHYDAVQTAVGQLINWKEVIHLVSSFVTDGANINVGHKSGLWALLENERQQELVKIPLMKIWCSVHRSALAWEKLTQNVPEVSKIILCCSSISSYFHQSGVRTKELKKIADFENTKNVQLPKYFDVRWTEFTYSLLVSILRNWRILVKYFTIKCHEEKDSKANGIYKFLTDINKLKLLCFLTDLGYLYTRFQKQIQCDDLLIFDVEERRNGLIKNIENLRNAPLVGGWEELFTKEIITEINPNSNKTITKLKDIELFDKSKLGRQKKNHNLYVSEDSSFSAIRNDIIEHLLNYVSERLDITEWSFLKPLATISEHTTDEELSKCHGLICSDFELVEFVTSYREVSCVQNFKNKKISKDMLKMLLSNECWKSLSTAVARIIAAKPHSADVERIISYYNVLKTCKRSSLSPETIKNSLYIKINMPVVAEFDPQPAVLKWLNSKNRHSKVHPLGRQQEWYEGVFPEAKLKGDEPSLFSNKVSF